MPTGCRGWSCLGGHEDVAPGESRMMGLTAGTGRTSDRRGQRGPPPRAMRVHGFIRPMNGPLGCVSTKNQDAQWQKRRLPVWEPTEDTWSIPTMRL